MNDIDRIKNWFAQQGREAPWTWTFICVNAVTWMLVFFGMTQPGEFLYGPLGLETAWRWLLYPLFAPFPILNLILSLAVFSMFSGVLERSWGSVKYLRVFVTVTLATATLFYLGSGVVQQTASPSVTMPRGIMHVELTLLVIWAALHSESTILAFFVIPVKAWWIALLVLIFEFVQNGPILGFFAIAVPVAGWFWAKRDTSFGRRPKKSLSERFNEQKREIRKKQFKVLPGKGIEVEGTSPTAAPDLRAVRRAQEAQKRTAEQAELDRILDKIRFDGMESLTSEERQTLDSHSKKLNDENFSGT